MEYLKHEIAKRVQVGYDYEGSKDFLFEYLELKNGRRLVLKIQTPGKPFEKPFTRMEIPESDFSTFTISGKTIASILAELKE